MYDIVGFGSPTAMHMCKCGLALVLLHFFLPPPLLMPVLLFAPPSFLAAATCDLVDPLPSLIEPGTERRDCCPLNAEWFTTGTVLISEVGAMEMMVKVDRMVFG